MDARIYKYSKLIALQILLAAGADTEMLNQDRMSRSSYIYINTITLESEMTPLMYASRYGYIGMMKLLISAGANLEALGNNGETPLILAVIGNSYEAVELLIRSGANVDVRDSSGNTVLMHAAMFIDRAAVHDPTVNAYSVNRDIIKLLLDSSADIDATNKNGKTALMLAQLRKKGLAIEALAKRM